MVSVATVKVLGAFLDATADDHYGFGLMRLTGVKAGSLYPILDRLERAGWLEARNEDIDEVSAGRPKRRLYRLTPIGKREGRRALADFYRDLGPVPRWALTPERM